MSIGLSVFIGLFILIGVPFIGALVWRMAKKSMEGSD